MDTMANLRTWNDRQTMADNLDQQGRRRNGDYTRTADMGTPLRDVAARQGAAFRNALATGRQTPAQQDMAAKVAAVKAAQGARTPQARPAMASVGAADRPTFKQVDALAATVPVGFYALPRREASTSGNTVTFFKVHKFRGGHRIVQVVGSVGAYVEQPLKLELQYFALKHIAENVAGAAALYGQEKAECGFCRAKGRHSPLTQERSRKAGYGQQCAETNGLPW